MKKIMSLLLVLSSLLLMTACHLEVNHPKDESQAIIEVDFGQAIEKVNVVVKADEDKTLFEVLDQHFTITYSTEEYGRMLKTISTKDGRHTINPPFGSYISILIDGESSLTGVDDTIVTAGKTYLFKLEWWDPIAQLNYTINAFVENYADRYMNEDYIDPNVAAAFAHLGILDDYLTINTVHDYFDRSEASTSGDLYKAILVITALGGNPTDFNGENLIERLVALNDTGRYSAPNNLIALNTYSHDFAVKDYEDDLLEVLKTTSKPSQESGLDLSGMTLAAFAPYKENEGIQSIINDYTTFLTDNLSEDGGIRDEQWDMPENSSSLAQLIIGLVALGIDPRSDSLKQDQGDLITRLLEYANGDGSFYYTLDETEPDLQFSTPQAFLALVVYQQFLEHESSVPYYQFSSNE